MRVLSMKRIKIRVCSVGAIARSSMLLELLYLDSRAPQARRQRPVRRRHFQTRPAIQDRVCHVVYRVVNLLVRRLVVVLTLSVALGKPMAGHPCLRRLEQDFMELDGRPLQHR